MDTIEEYVACEICGRDSTRFVRKLKDRSMGFSGNFKLVKCDTCGLLYLNPRPAPNAIKKFYPADYACYLENKITSGQKIKQFALKSRNKYCSSLKGMVGRTIFLLLENYFWGIPLMKREGKLLDIGCGNGYFLKLLSDTGNWQTFGIEPSQAVVDYTKSMGLNVVTGTIDDADYGNDFFDVIRLWHVFEHLHNPMKELDKIRHMLCDKGELIIGVPNVESIPSKIFFKYWYGLEAPRHLYHFTPETLQKMLEAKGFTIAKIKHVGGRSIVGSLQLVWDSIIERLTGRLSYGGTLFNNRKLVVLFLPLEYVMNLFGFGDTVEIHAIK